MKYLLMVGFQTYRHTLTINNNKEKKKHNLCILHPQDQFHRTGNNHPNYTAFQLEPVTCMIEHTVCIKVSTVITPIVMIVEVACEGVLKNSRFNTAIGLGRAQRPNPFKCLASSE